MQLVYHFIGQWEPSCETTTFWRQVYHEQPVSIEILFSQFTQHIEQNFVFAST